MITVYGFFLFNDSEIKTVCMYFCTKFKAGPGNSVRVAGLILRQHSFVKIGHEIISTAILSLPLIQVGQLSVTGKRMCTKYWLTA